MLCVVEKEMPCSNMWPVLELQVDGAVTSVNKSRVLENNLGCTDDWLDPPMT
jgi:hypothetical protein